MAHEPLRDIVVTLRIPEASSCEVDAWQGADYTPVAQAPAIDVSCGVCGDVGGHLPVHAPVGFDDRTMTMRCSHETTCSLECLQAQNARQNAGHQLFWETSSWLALIARRNSLPVPVDHRARPRRGCVYSLPPVILVNDLRAAAGGPASR